jgi:hypothetical protein
LITNVITRSSMKNLEYFVGRTVESVALDDAGKIIWTFTDKSRLELHIHTIVGVPVTTDAPIELIDDLPPNVP